MTATRTTLLALAERVEAATGADRELDAQVARYSPHLVKFLGGVPDEPQHGCLHYTRSVDDVIMFLDGRDWSMAADCEGATATVIGRDGPEHGHAATTALALTAATLRALAERMTDED